MRRNKSRVLRVFFIVLFLLLLTGCKTAEEMQNVPTPRPETNRVIVNNQPLAPEHSISVHGTGEVIATPDFATLTLRVTSTAETAEAVSLDCTEKMKQVFLAASRRGLYPAARKVSAIEIQPILSETEDAPVSYTAAQSVTYTVNSTLKINELVSAFVDSGLTELVGVSYRLLDASAAYRDALAAAMADAHARAEVMATAAGLKLGAVIGASEVDAFEKDIADQTFESSEIAVSAEVQVTYLIP